MRQLTHSLIINIVARENVHEKDFLFGVFLMENLSE